MLLLSLIAAFCGTPLRLAEASADLARSFAELGDDAGIECIDGGVGDDSDATIRTSVTRLSTSLAYAHDFTAIVVVAPSPPADALVGSGEPPDPKPTCLLQRLAWLQCFRC
jgi:hypothetical protein